MKKLADERLAQLNREINELKAAVREHGRAAQKINKILGLYLGHSELTISLLAEGYEINRHGKRLSAPPSEGEKTAIALSYFLASLEAEDRRLKNTIVVIDDPISSLDSKALNYACALVRTSIDNASRVFLLTHNLACMNEFKKAWRRRAYPDDKTKDPTARLLFMDVRIPSGGSVRNTAIIELPKLLRVYDLEYHLLLKHVVDFVSEGKDYPYGYLMPNVVRRVLDVFLAFKCPGSDGLATKMDHVCRDLDFDRARVLALDRLAQAESHSDSLDDLLSLSPITVEEALPAAEALLEFMRSVDPKHTDRAIKLCND